MQQRAGALARAIAAAAVIAAAWGVPAHAQTTAITDSVKTENITARLVSERIALVPGRTAWLALHFTIRPGWHTYWLNPGDAGEKTEIIWTLPRGFSAGAIQWPAPERLLEPGNIAVYGYTGTATHLVAVSVPADALPGERVTLAAEARWLVCEKICLPEEGKFQLTLPVQSPGSEPPVDGRAADIFDAARAALPKPSPWTARFALDGKTLTLHFDGAALDASRIASIEFFPNEPGAITPAAPQEARHDAKGMSLVLAAASRANTFRSLEGVLIVKERLEGGTVTQSFAVAATPGAVPAGGAALSLGLALLMALAGGVILNLMPCVFPVLSIKVLSFAAHGRGGRMGAHGLAYTAGVLALFAVVGAVLVALKGAGAEIGWGFQLQEPIFVMLMAYLMFVIGLNLSGLFELGGRFAGLGGRLAARDGLSGAFFTGALAAVVATPCTAPFMAAAIGYAVTQPAPVAMAVTLALGLGMASPFLVLSYSPGLLRRLPKPGPWMERFRQFLAFPMYATAAWLVWVLSLQAGDGALLAALAGAILIAFGVWAWSAARDAGTRTRHVAAAFAVLALAGAGALVAWADRGTPAQTASADGRWVAFDAAKLEAYRSEGRPVFLNFTAAWCVTCLVNEKAVLASDAVWAAMKQKGVVAMKADWTRRDPAITRALAALGRSGVPVYAVYPPGSGAPVLLPQILTESAVLAQFAAFPDRPVNQRAGR